MAARLLALLMVVACGHFSLLAAPPAAPAAPAVPGAPAAPAAPAAPVSDEFAGLTVGTDTVKDIAKQVKRREELVGPGKATLEPDEGLQAQTYRYTGSFDKDRSVTSTMLYFSSKGTLAGFDLFLRGKSTFDRYERELARKYAQTEEGRYQGELATGAFKGAKVSVALTSTGGGKSGYKSYQVEVRCFDILRQDKGADDGGK